MLAARHRFPSRGSMAGRTAARGRTEEPMLTEPPPEGSSRGIFAGNPLPIQNLVGTAIRELRTSMLNTATAIRLGDNSSKPRYFGTAAPDPQVWLSPVNPNSEDAVSAGAINAGNAPQMMNKTASQGEPPRIAASLPQRSR